MIRAVHASGAVRAYATAGRLEGYTSRLLDQEAAQHVASSGKTEVTTLGNKFRVASEKLPGERASIAVHIDAGSSFETPANNGVAHFLEHMAFKGTGRRTEAQIEAEAEGLACSLNAYTSRESTVYFANTFREDVPKVVDLLADLLQNSTYAAGAIEKERSTILREMEHVEKDPREVMFDHLHAVAYPKQALGQTILGPEANIRSIGQADLKKYVDTHYTGPRMVLVGAGAVEHEELVALGEQFFGGVSSEVRHNVSDEARPHVVGSTVLVRDERVPLVHHCVALEAADVSSPHFFTFAVLREMVGDWDRSWGVGKYGLSNVAESLAAGNLAHSLSTFYVPYRNTGLFGSYMVSEPDTVVDATHAVVSDWARIGTSATDFEVEVAKSKVKSSLFKALDTPGDHAEDIGRQLLSIGRRLPLTEIIERVDAVDAKTVRAVADEYFHDMDPVGAAVGSIDTAKYPEYNLLRSWTSRWRL